MVARVVHMFRQLAAVEKVWDMVEPVLAVVEVVVLEADYPSRSQKEQVERLLLNFVVA